MFNCLIKYKDHVGNAHFTWVSEEKTNSRVWIMSGTVTDQILSSAWASPPRLSKQVLHLLDSYLRHLKWHNQLCSCVWCLQWQKKMCLANGVYPVSLSVHSALASHSNKSILLMVCDKCGHQVILLAWNFWQYFSVCHVQWPAVNYQAHHILVFDKVICCKIICKPNNAFVHIMFLKLQCADIDTTAGKS